MHKKSIAVIFLISIIILIVAISSSCNTKPKTAGEWNAPAEMEKLKIPFDNSTIAAQKGNELYNVYCWACHGETGNGDGAAGGSPGAQPANFHSQKVKNQTDGSLFWNALEISPDGKYIFVNSGVRTDHGEVQDNGGAYPNARDNALTRKIFRFPVDAKDLFLEDDETKLKAAGFIYAEGIRNAYDMAFDPETNLFINKSSHSWQVSYFHTDSGFPKIPKKVKFSPGVQNLGPDANEYRGHSGQILDRDQTGVPVSTFTAHCSPLGFFFDRKRILAGGLTGDGFVIRYTLGARSGLMRPFTMEGGDLLHLDLTYDKITDNYFVSVKRIVEGFTEPTDAVLVKNEVFVIEYGGQKGNIWKISLPLRTKDAKRKTSGKK